MSDWTQIYLENRVHEHQQNMHPGRMPPAGSRGLIGEQQTGPEEGYEYQHCPEGITLAAAAYWRGGKNLFSSDLPNEWYASAQSEYAGPPAKAGEGLDFVTRWENALGFAQARYLHEGSQVTKRTYLDPRFLYSRLSINPEAMGYERGINASVWQHSLLDITR